MKFHKLFLLLAAITLILNAQAQKTVYDPNAQIRTVGSFTAIDVSSSIDLYLSMGENAVAVSAKENSYTEKITTEVRNGTLFIGVSGNGGWGAKSLKAYVSIKTINKLVASGASDVFVDGALAGTDLSIYISGASDFKGAVNATNLRLEATGSSDFHISGTSTNAKIKLSGSSDLKGYDLAIDNCDVEASGSSDVKITVNKELRATASGASDIYYKGEPTVKDVKSSGASDIKKAG